VIHELEKAILIAKHPVVRGNLMGLGSVDERGGSVQPVASKAGFGSNQDAKVGGLEY
jgi:hypothetical protein